MDFKLAVIKTVREHHLMDFTYINTVRIESASRQFLYYIKLDKVLGTDIISYHDDKQDCTVLDLDAMTDTQLVELKLLLL